MWPPTARILYTYPSPEAGVERPEGGGATGAPAWLNQSELKEICAEGATTIYWI